MAMFGKDSAIPEELRARIKELEEENLKLQIDNEDYEAKLIARGVQPVMEAPLHREDGTYDYRIDLPPSGGMDLKINGVQYFHGQTYRFDVDLLRTVQEMIHRSWTHEETIHGSNENSYRPHLNTTLTMRGRRQ